MQSKDLADYCLKQADTARWEETKAKYDALNVSRKAANDSSDMSRFEQNYSKYFELERWLKYHARHATQVKLHEGVEGRRVVDIGCGSGIFPFIAKCLGHHAEGFDIESEMYQDMAASLDVKYTVARVTAFEPLPGDYADIDVFSAIATKFDRQDFADRKAETWSVEAWRYFFADLATRLRDDGVFYLKPNKFTDEQFFELPEVGAFFEERAVSVTQSREYIFSKSALA